MTRSVAVTLAIAILAAGAAPARAQADSADATTTSAVAGERGASGRPIVGILEVRVDGVSPTVAERFEQSIEEGLSSGELWVATRTRMREMLAGSSWSEGCVMGPCLGEVERQTGAAFVVVAYFQGRGSSYRFVVSLTDTRRGVVRDQVADRCEVCTLTEALDAAALATIGLVHGAATVPPPPVARKLAPAPKPRRIGRQTARRSALFLVGSAVIVGGASAFFLAKDRDAVGYAGAGTAGTLATSGLVLFGLSFALD